MVKERFNQLLNVFLLRKEKQEESIYKWIYEVKSIKRKSWMDIEPKENMQLLKQLERIWAELEQKYLDFVERINKEMKKREETLAEIKEMECTDGKQMQRPIVPVVKAYGDLKN